MHERLRQALLHGERQGAHYALHPPRIAPVGLVGAQLGSRSGTSIEFMDHREYQPGDDLRTIDWSSFARSDRLIVKLYREEVSPHLDLVLDASRSMDLPDTPKAEAALAVAAVFATAASNASFTHALWLAGDGFRRSGGLSPHPGSWRDIAFEYDRDMERSFTRLPPAWRRQGVRVLVSDLLWSGDPVPLVRRAAEGASSLVIVQVLSRADTTPPQRGNLRLVDSETGEQMELYIDAAAEKRFRATFERHQDHWRNACRQVGAVLATVVAEDVLERWDFQELVRHQVLQVK